MKKTILILIAVLVYNSLQAQKALPYNEYIDYYRENVKSTILTKQGDFLKDGKYKFSGNAYDFRFLLSYVLKYDMKDFKPSDTLIYEGEIKDSLKVNVWQLTLHKKDKPLDLIYHKKKNIVVPGVNYNDNRYGMLNEIINIKDYYELGMFNYANLGSSAIDTFYNFGGVEYNMKKKEYYVDEKHTFVSSLKINDKKDDKTLYTEYLEHIVNLSQVKKFYYKKRSYFKYNDSASLEIATEKLSLKNNKKINNYIYENILFLEVWKNSWEGKNKYISINVTEGFKDDKLVQLKFDYEGKEIQCPFTKFLNTNYYPIILYDVSRIE